jgi:3-deoxy-D-manno-octulosonate 8-phosphate phosphatase (KDO 8-P phosphatase)
MPRTPAMDPAATAERPPAAPLTASADVLERARRVRLLVLDVDGVLTDGRLFFTDRGEELKVFHVRDGAGLVALHRAGIEVAIISGRESGAVVRRAAELRIRHVRQGVAHKGEALTALLAELHLADSDVACVGDDSPDVPMLERAALAVAVADAHSTARAVAHWTTTAPGGCGAVREVCDLLLIARGS